jgi:hypothetical protein
MQTQIDRLVKQFMVQLSSAVAESLGEVMGELPSKTPVRAGKVSQPSDSTQTKRTAKSKPNGKKGSAKDEVRLAIVAALRKGESCEALASKYKMGVGSLRAIKANLTRGTYD